MNVELSKIQAKDSRQDLFLFCKMRKDPAGADSPAIFEFSVLCKFLGSGTH